MADCGQKLSLRFLRGLGALLGRAKLFLRPPVQLSRICLNRHEPLYVSICVADGSDVKAHPVRIGASGVVEHLCAVALILSKS